MLDFSPIIRYNESMKNKEKDKMSKLTKQFWDLVKKGEIKVVIKRSVEQALIDYPKMKLDNFINKANREGWVELVTFKFESERLREKELNEGLWA
tara:strand:- start:428 stop:712 length:285 start_codon:yes stop_codon:yes gene_type:complete